MVAEIGGNACVKIIVFPPKYLKKKKKNHIQYKDSTNQSLSPLYLSYPEVLYFQLNSVDMRRLVNLLHSSYNELMQYAVNAYRK